MLSDFVVVPYVLEAVDLAGRLKLIGFLVPPIVNNIDALYDLVNFSIALGGGQSPGDRFYF